MHAKKMLILLGFCSVALFFVTVPAGEHHAILGGVPADWPHKQVNLLISYHDEDIEHNVDFSDGALPIMGQVVAALQSREVAVLTTASMTKPILLMGLYAQLASTGPLVAGENENLVKFSQCSSDAESSECVAAKERLANLWRDVNSADSAAVFDRLVLVKPYHEIAKEKSLGRIFSFALSNGVPGGVTTMPDRLMQFASVFNLSEFDVYVAIADKGVHSADNRFVLFIPKKYSSTIKAFNSGLLKKYEFADDLAIRTKQVIKLLDVLTFGDSGEHKLPVENVDTLAFSIMRLLKKSPKYAWNVTIAGHGLRVGSPEADFVPVAGLLKHDFGSMIAGMPTTQFVKLMDFFNAVPTNILLLISCHSGGYIAKGLSQTLTISQALAHKQKVMSDKKLYDEMEAAKESGQLTSKIKELKDSLKKNQFIMVSFATYDSPVAVFFTPKSGAFFRGVSEFFKTRKPPFDEHEVKVEMAKLLEPLTYEPGLIRMPGETDFEPLKTISASEWGRTEKLLKKNFPSEYAHELLAKSGKEFTAGELMEKTEKVA